jgi:release factor glutamine methyltransferase
VNVADAVSFTAEKLREGDVPDARRDAELFVSFVAGRDKTFLIAHPEHELSANEEMHLDKLTARRLTREPLQYILGRQEFYGLEFVVTPDVLIPRPETEILVERAIEFLKPLGDPSFCEIGVGSGCISISVLCNVTSVRAIATDISTNAINIARANAVKHTVADRISFVESDVYSNVPETQFDAILSNPPYVPEIDFDSLQPEVRDYEPHLALTSGDLGLDVITRLTEQAPAYLKPGGLLIFEMGFNQSAAVSGMFDPRVWQNAEILPDLQGIPRIAVAVKQ